MRIHQTVLPEMTTSLPPARNAMPEPPRWRVMQEQAAFTPLSQKEGHASFSLRGLLNTLPSMPFSILPPSVSHLFSSRKEADMDALGKKPRVYESNLAISCNENAGQTTLMEQSDYLQTLKTQLPDMKKKVQSVEDGACLGLSTLWLLGRHSGLDDKTVIGNLLGYDADKDEVISGVRAKSGFEKIHVVQEKFQNSARIDGQFKDRRFDGAAPVVKRYDLMQRIANLAKMSVIPVRGETPFVLLNRREGFGDGLVSDVLREGREQLLAVHSDGHAMAIYSNGHDQYAFYDPNNGMFSFQNKENLASFMNRIGKMLNVASDTLANGDPDQLMIMEMKVH
ncbi:hypothetical protein DDT52_15600 [Brenneria roseae subsp. roseae]|uniref:YopT-type cysteine protease domain-containing protein n=1 Tax=Brenneria roseae TaxID=1509241 RepID=UPI000D60CEDA|nr:YopT-type cysteine protease domain-containing protein [Brenneria roseae]PWC17500.1 hypothetical protein DDT52_15600 [Brenneria roseae subsp. roseae]